MRVLLVPKNLEVGGTQEAATRLAVALKDLGHEVVVVGEPGPLAYGLGLAGVEILAMPAASGRSSRLRALREAIALVRPDVIGAFEYPDILNACLAARLSPSSPPVAGSIYSTRVPWFLPESVPLTVAKPELLDFTQRWHSGLLMLVPPPVDATGPNCDIAPSPHGADPGIVLVSRLVLPFKREMIERSIHAMSMLDAGVLTIIGDGPARGHYERCAQSLNRQLGREAVRFEGECPDPMPYVRSADLVLGSGMSAIEAAMAATPTIVMGREGYAQAVHPAAIDTLISNGFYGVGDGDVSAGTLATAILRHLDKAALSDLQRTADTLNEHYGVDSVAARYSAFLKLAMEYSAPSWDELARAAARRVHYRYRNTRLRRAAPRHLATPEIVDDWVFGRLRELPVAPPARWTGRHMRSPSSRRRGA